MKISEIKDAQQRDDGGSTVLDRQPHHPSQGERKKEEPKTPKMYHVMLNNDDYTPAEAVVHVLVDVFNMNTARAGQLMLAAHRQGKAIIGTYTHDIAEAKCQKAIDDLKKHTGRMAKQHNVDVEASSYVFTTEAA